jgi:hypothetical protein
MVREVDVQPSHPGSNPHGCRFGFLLLKNTVGASPTVILSKKKDLHFHQSIYPFFLSCSSIAFVALVEFGRERF